MWFSAKCGLENFSIDFIKSKLFNIALISFVFLGFLNHTASTQTSSAPEVIVVSGRTYDRQTTMPIEGASVRFSSLDASVDVQLLTDKNGSFDVRLPIGIYNVQFVAFGYQSEEEVGNFLPVPVSDVVGATSVFVFRTPRLLEPLNSSKVVDKTKVQAQARGNLVVGSLPKTRVTVESQDGNLIYKNMILSDQLLATFYDLPAQTYRIAAELEGYQILKKEVMIVAEKTTTLTLNLRQTESLQQVTENAGKFFALVIGINNYQSYPQLKTAEQDAKDVNDLLHDKYGFETKLLLNATREQLLGALFEYRRKTDSNWNLLIYYAGHGLNDSEADKAYWLPADAKKDDNANWISADDITANIKALHAKHILVVSDSCFSGALSRVSGAVIISPELSARDGYLLKVLDKSSRTLLASGGNEPVADGGGKGNHSVFASAFLKGMLEAERKVFTAEELYLNSIKEAVAGKSAQTPEYNPIRNSGDGGGAFLFIKK
jgi:uncharacterized caspase-like protein